MNWRREDLAWLAGLVEGEGTFTTRVESPRNNPYGRTSIAMRVAMTDEDVVRRAHAVAQVGRVYGPYKKAGGRYKDYWVWSCAQRDTVAMVAALWPWLGTRRRARATELLQLWKSEPRHLARQANGRWGSAA